MKDELEILSEITLLPDGRVHVHGVTREVMELLKAAGIGREIASDLLRHGDGETDDDHRDTNGQPGSAACGPSASAAAPRT